jgi:hypothetical protein
VTLPTADHIAVAIVAACQQTDEDPVKCAQRGSKIRARHYAMHALVRVFPAAPKRKIANWCGAYYEASKFYENSCTNTANPNASRLAKRKTDWWNDEIFYRVVRALEAAKTASAIEYRPPPGTIEKVLRDDATRNLGRLEPNGYRPPADAIAKELADDDPVFDRGRFNFRKPREDTFESSREQANRMLREAAANTAKLQPPQK